MVVQPSTNFEVLWAKMIKISSQGKKEIINDAPWKKCSVVTEHLVMSSHVQPNQHLFSTCYFGDKFSLDVGCWWPSYNYTINI